MPQKPKSPAKKGGDVDAGQDAILYNPAELARSESLLERAIRLLSRPGSSVAFGGDKNSTIMITDNQDDLRLTVGDIDAFGTLAQNADSKRREQIYLVRFMLTRSRSSVSPAGSWLETPLRLNDRDDQSISSAGLPITDIRQALARLGKTRLVILGDPGAGKTTLLDRLGLDLARERLRDPLAGKLPLRADLFKFSAVGMQPDVFLKDLWGTTGLGLTYNEAIAQGQVCFLLDGLNQLPLVERSKRLERWKHWAKYSLPPENWAVFTCRSANYVADLRLPEVSVQPLDTGQVRRYFELRFPPERAGDLWAGFEQRLRSGDDRFQGLARNPFMLSQLAGRCDAGQPPTGSRAALLADLATRLPDHIRHPEMFETLSRLAYAMQARGEGAYLSRAEAGQAAPAAKGPGRFTLDETLQRALDAALLQEVDLKTKGKTEQGYVFCHPLLQEYFAAHELLRQFRSIQASELDSPKANGNPSRAARSLTKHWRVAWQKWEFPPKEFAPGERLAPPPITGWEETAILAAVLADDDTARFIATVKKDNLPLAGRCLAEVGAERAGLQALADSIRAELLLRQRNPGAHLRARIDAGLALGEAGHPDLRPQEFEFEGRSIWAIEPPLQAIPAGEFLRGSERSDERAYPNEYTTERKLTLSAFAIGRYAVTNAEYRFFVEDGGYKNDCWWSEAGLQWKQGGAQAHAGMIDQWMENRAFMQKQENIDAFVAQVGWRPHEAQLWKDMIRLSDEDAREFARAKYDRRFDQPAYWHDATLSNPARPSVGVNWHEASAYCAWLSAVTKRAFRLPSEMQWEKAARGVDGREYAWGDEFDPAHCNTLEAHTYTTMPVGLYPEGASPFGLFDASGNTWEWLDDWYQVYPGGEPDDGFFGEKYRVLRGGSWFNSHWNARCAYRYRLAPVVFFSDIGFRLVSV